jgi:hypothetical protein
MRAEPSPLRLKHTTLSCMGELDRDAIRAIRDRMLRSGSGMVWRWTYRREPPRLPGRAMAGLAGGEYRLGRGRSCRRVAVVPRHPSAAGTRPVRDLPGRLRRREALSQGHNAWLH